MDVLARIGFGDLKGDCCKPEVRPAMVLSTKASTAKGGISTPGLDPLPRGYTTSV